MNSLRGGMQVHAVPESERAFDTSGRRLPWGYEYADADLARRREPEEKGPFGRATRRRGFSRSKTATPARKEDAVRMENMQNEDAIFNNYKAKQRAKDPAAAPQKSGIPLTSLDPNMASNAQMLSAREGEPTEVILYGYGQDQQWAAIEFYERVSNGAVYEDYDRHPPHQRYDLSLSYSRAAAQRSLSKPALTKRNAYRGGDHWIKVTFDSPEAADLACDRSPHALHGHLVYAEPYRGAGPPNDSAIPYSNAGARVDSDSLPRSFSTTTLSAGRQTTSPSGSSNTVSSATATANNVEDQLLQWPSTSSLLPRSTTTPSFSSLDPFQSRSLSRSESTSALQEQSTPGSNTALRQRTPHIAGAKRAVLLPADQAFLPTAPKYASTLASWPLVGALFAPRPGDSAGAQVPRLEDGSFDWKSAGLYWRFFAWLDAWFGTDICGLRGDE